MSFQSLSVFGGCTRLSRFFFPRQRFLSQPCPICRQPMDPNHAQILIRMPPKKIMANDNIVHSPVIEFRPIHSWFSGLVIFLVHFQPKKYDFVIIFFLISLEPQKIESGRVKLNTIARLPHHKTCLMLGRFVNSLELSALFFSCWFRCYHLPDVRTISDLITSFFSPFFFSKFRKIDFFIRPRRINILWCPPRKLQYCCIMIIS